MRRPETERDRMRAIGGSGLGSPSDKFSQSPPLGTDGDSNCISQLTVIQHADKTIDVKFSDQLRQAIDSSGLSRNRICVEIGLDRAVMSKFMAGTSGLSVKNIDKICDLLGLKLTAGTLRKGR